MVDSELGQIPQGWKVKKLGDVCSTIFSGGTPSTQKDEFWNGNIPWLSSGETRNRLITETEKRITLEGVQGSSTRLALSGDVVVASAGQGNTRGHASLCMIDTYINQSLIALRANNQFLVSGYLFAILSTNYETLRAISDSSSSRGSLNQAMFRDFPINLPPLPIQHKIAAILSAYDDLIENNNRRIKILEEMAQNIYREWFVHFRYPGHEDVPMVDSELGQIPQGWEVKKLGDITEVIDCLHSKKPSESTSETEQHGILLHLWNIDEGGRLDLSKKFFIKKDDYELWISRVEAHEGDCVITNVGRIAAVAQIPVGVKAAIGRNMTLVRCTSTTITPTYLIEYLLSSHMTSEVLKKADAGTIMGSMNVRGIKILDVPTPPSGLMLRFEKKVRPVRRRMELLSQQNQNLRKTRDLLLPKLISGQLDVEELDIELSKDV